MYKIIGKVVVWVIMVAPSAAVFILYIPQKPIPALLGIAIMTLCNVLALETVWPRDKV